jgi:hypothetical protein
LTRVCSAEGFTPKTTLETADIAAAVALVSRGLGTGDEDHRDEPLDEA